MVARTSTERKALDHSHHLSELAVRRGVSPLKGLFKYVGKPGMLILAGGGSRPRLKWIVLDVPREYQAYRLRTTSLSPRYRPRPSPLCVVLFIWCIRTPFDIVQDSFGTSTSKASSESTSWFWKLLGFGSSKERTTEITIPKYPTELGQVNLATSLQYGAATGIVQLQSFFNDFTGKVFQPAYDDWTTKVHTGNTDA
jgi:aromatic amino acid aminotransferase I